VHHEISVSENSNCKADNVPVLTVSSSTRRNSEEIERQDEQIQLNGIDDVLLSKDVDLIVTYIAGFVVRRTVTATIIRQCDTCKTLLIDKAKSTKNAGLIEMKNRGRLTYPSNAAKGVCLDVEKFIRQNSNFIFHSAFLATVTNLIVEKYIGASDHCHSTLLLKKICSIYLKIRLNHEAKFFLKIEKYIRRVNTKLILFQGQ
jgi:hypothetical protein